MASASQAPFDGHAYGVSQGSQAPQTPQTPQPNSPQFSNFAHETGRSEPSFYAQPNVGGMAYNSMAYGDATLPTKSKAMRIMLILSCTVAIVSAGLIGAWWMDNDIVVGAVNTVSDWIQPDVQAKTAHSSTKKATVAAGGISPEELPYDGFPQAANASNAAFVPQRNSNSNSVGDSVNSNSISATSEDQKNESGSEDGEAAKARSRTASLPPAVKDTVKNRAAATAADDVSKEAPPVSHPKQAQHAKSSKHKAVSKAERGREINRMQQQADDELKKKAERHKRALAQEVAKNESAGSSEQKQQYASSAEIVSTRRKNMHAWVEKCTSMDNLIDREKCKWRICNGQWGKNGCPSYAAPPTIY